ncbi:MAG: hypothetical protein HGB08_00975 [Candidatus Moranbacteria bacterium]|nr:hypothetical protein [Candidatus Moranbacteria bacterium]
MKDATLKQAGKVLTLMENTPCEQLQELLGSGLLSDLLSCDTKRISRDEFRKMCGLKPLVPEPVVRLWQERDGVIRFTLPPTDGTTGPQWIDRLEGKGFRLSKWAKDVLNSEDFKPTSGVICEIAVLKGMLWNDNKRIIKNIRADADNRKLTKPSAEVACMIREMFSDDEIEAMGLFFVVTMHEPIIDSDGGPDLLYARRDGGGRWMHTACVGPDYEWRCGYGFAFVASQVVSAQDSATQS